MTPKVDDIKAVKYYEEVARLMNEMLGELKEMNLNTKQHNKTVEELSERVRKIGVNTSNL